MKIINVKVKGILRKQNIIEMVFNDDLNIITGKNGAGKTTVLKLVWYITSGNISQAVSEIDFDWVEVITDEYICKVFKISSNTCKAEYTPRGGSKRIIEDEFGDENGVDSFIISDAREILSEELSPLGRTVFFPTFRRIEGGFSVGGRKSRNTIQQSRQSRDLEEAMSALSNRMSSERHTFISSISTIDIESMLLKNYANLSENVNRLQQRVSDEIIEKIRGYKKEVSKVGDGDTEAIESANEVIDAVRARIEEMEQERRSIMVPMTAIQKLASQFFAHSGIKFGTRLSIGGAAEAINSDALSAGEKQMLSFICYNAFTKDCVTFIDEPELSLHVDWQRQLFPTLLSQRSGNQFIVATHSPFIYSKYPDKEICIDSSGDRGNTNAYIEVYNDE